MTLTPVFLQLLEDVRACTLCAAELPLGPRPVIHLHPAARILVVGQAPGRKVHETRQSFNDASGDRLRSWMGVTRDEFYDERQIALIPMAFCYPGTGASGDLPPPPRCALTWRARLLEQLQHLELTIVLGQYAQAYHITPSEKSLTENVRNWRRGWPRLIPLPHPSPRNNIWLRKNPWFEAEVIPVLRQRVREILSTAVTPVTPPG